MMADRYRGTLYIGVTSNLAARVWAHRRGARLQVLRALQPDETRLRRVCADYRKSHCTRKSPEEVEPRMEDRADRKSQSRLERPLRNDQRLKEAGLTCRSLRSPLPRE